jgi:hypothetical protein
VVIHHSVPIKGEVDVRQIVMYVSLATPSPPQVHASIVPIVSLQSQMVIALLAALVHSMLLLLGEHV